MVSRTVKDDTGTVTESDNYIYDGGNVALVLNADGQVTQRDLYAAAVDQILATETVAPVSMGEQAAGLVNWLLPNNQGTIRDVAQYSGGAATVVDHVVYDPFGTITSQTNSTYQPFITYAGMQLDTVTGLLKDGVRQYDSNNSIFVSQDPIGYLDGGTNLAMYCANSPTNATDPSGLDQFDVSGGTEGTGGYYHPSPSYEMIPGASGSFVYTPPTNEQLAAQKLLRQRQEASAEYFRTHRIYSPIRDEYDYVADRARHGDMSMVGLICFDHWIICMGACAEPIESPSNFPMVRFEPEENPEPEPVGIESGDPCFPAGTPVASVRGHVPIENLKSGEEVWGYDLATCTWRPCPIRRTFEHSYTGKYITVSVADDAIVSTFNHPYWVARGENLDERPNSKHAENRPEGATTLGRWVDAGHLREGDELLLRDGRVVPILSILHNEASGIVYNIEVDELECYAVGINNVLVHNKSSTEEPVRAPSENDDIAFGLTRAKREALAAERPTRYRKGVVETVWKNAQDKDGRVFDPNTFTELQWDPSTTREGQWDMGHIPEASYEQLKQRFINGEISRSQFLDEYNNPANYRPEAYSPNRSRRFQ
jgi:RHS repeat-associated protein